MSYQKYENYRDSGVEWLGNIPCGWKIKALRYLADPITGLTYSPQDVTLPEDGTLVLRASNIQNGKLDIEGQSNVYVDTRIPQKLKIQGEDILVCSRNGSRHLIGKNALISNPDREMTFGAFNTVLRGQHNQFLYWVLNSKLFEFQSARFLTSTINQLTIGTFKTLRIPFPSKLEQGAISKFLSEQTEEIDRLIKKKEKLLALLGEKRTALISQAVTKGLDPTAPMKSSGIEWLGEIPAGWQLIKLRFLCKINTGSRDTENRVADGKYPFFVRSQTIENINSYALDTEAVLTAGDGAGVGKVFHYFNGKFDYHQRVYAFTDFHKTSGKFFFHFFSQFFGLQMNIYSAKSTVDSVRRPFLQELFFCVPPEDQQNEIVNYVEKETKYFEEVESKVEFAISKLKEYRSALITNTVTGKIKVT